MSKRNKSNGFSEYKMLIMSEIEENKKFRATMTEAITKIRESVSGLNGKASVIGGVAGTIGAGIVSIVVSLFHK